MSTEELTKILTEASAQTLEMFAEDMEQNVIPDCRLEDRPTILAVCIRARRTASEMRAKVSDIT